MKRSSKKGQRINRLTEVQELTGEQRRFEVRMAIVQTLIPLGVAAVNEEMRREAERLIGEFYARGKRRGPWGSNRGWVCLGDQEVTVRVPRVRDRRTNTEVPLRSYRRLQRRGLLQELALGRVIRGISMGEYEEAALSVPETLGISRDSVSRRWIRAGAKKLAALNERNLDLYDIVAIFLDCKHFSTDHEIVVALGVTIAGEKVILGIVEISTENYIACRDFVRSLLKRGLRVDDPIQCIIDGGKGIHKGLKEVLGDRALLDESVRRQ